MISGRWNIECMGRDKKKLSQINMTTPNITDLPPLVYVEEWVHCDQSLELWSSRESLAPDKVIYALPTAMRGKILTGLWEEERLLGARCTTCSRRRNGDFVLSDRKAGHLDPDWWKRDHLSRTRKDKPFTQSWKRRTLCSGLGKGASLLGQTVFLHRARNRGTSHSGIAQRTPN
jgi:hypothetical protein